MKVLAIKGGGVRGLLPARIGARLERELPGWSDRLDLIAGTSTGGIVALARAFELEWKEIVRLYRELAGKVFFRGATPEARAHALHEILSSVFQDATLRDLPTPVLVPAFRVQDGRAAPVFFTREREPGRTCVDVAMATAACPLYFPAHLGCLDGGLLANDPSILALVEAAGGLAQFGVQTILGRVSVLTLGCGRTRAPAGMVECLASGGLLGAVAPLLSSLGRHHLELDPRLPEEIPLDGGEDLDASVETLLNTAKHVELDRTLDWLEDHRWV